jgi:hypothetical protein
MLLGARTSSLNRTSGELKYSFDQAQHHLKYSEHFEFGINFNLTYTAHSSYKKDKKID